AIRSRSMRTIIPPWPLRIRRAHIAGIFWYRMRARTACNAKAMRESSAKDVRQRSQVVLGILCRFKNDHEKWVTRLSRPLFNRALLEKGRGWRGHQTRTAILF